MALYSEDDHKAEKPSMSVLAKVAWVVVAIYVWLIVMALMTPSPSRVPPTEKTRYDVPLYCFPSDGKLLCDKPPSP